MNPRAGLLFFFSCALIFFVSRAGAEDGYWDTAGGGSWASAGNWDSGTIADGTDDTAYFGITLFADIPASATFTLNGPRTIGHLLFTDQNGPDNWIVNPGSGEPLTLETTFDLPSITVIQVDQQITINAVLAGTNGVEKLGGGTLILAATNSLSGDVVLSAGTLRVNGFIKPDSLTVAGGSLAGIGTITGPVTVEAGGTFSPGNSPGTLTISNSLTLQPGCTTFVEVNASTLGRDMVKGLSTVNYGGVLTVSNLAGTAVPGQSFAVFNATSATGNFNGISPQLNNGLRWRFDPESGVLSVVSTNLQPRFAGIALSGGNVIMQVTNGVPGALNYLLAATDLALPRTSWTRLATNVFDAGGAVNIAVLTAPNTPQRFFQISTP